MSLGSSRRGFTLVELMVAVVIVAILAVVAVASYKKYQRNARVQQGVAYVNDIRMKQENFFSIYSRYLSSTTNPAVYDGDQMSGSMMPFFEFENDCPDTDNVWCNLGFQPPGQSFEGISGNNYYHFQFQTMGWAPNGPSPPNPPYATAPDTRWFVARARGLPDSFNNCKVITYAKGLPDIIISDEPCD